MYTTDTVHPAFSSAGWYDKPILYSCWRSCSSWRVRIALNLKNIPYDIKPVSLIHQHSEVFREINPMEQVPAMRIDGHTLIECMAIINYLEESRPQRPLLPQDPYRRAKVRQICEIICSDTQTLENFSVLEYVGEERKDEWARHWIARGLRVVEKIIGNSAYKYCVGNEITMADCCLIPQVFNARMLHIDLHSFPTILRIDNQLEGHPAFRNAHPSNQPDYPDLIKKKKEPSPEPSAKRMRTTK